MRKSTRALRLRQLDKQLARFKGLPVLPAGYIRTIRDVLGMSSTQLASRVGLTQSGVIRMEEREADSFITVKTLKRAAEALDCEFVYALVPKNSLAHMVLNQARSKAATEAGGIFHSMRLEQQSTEKEEQDELINERAQELIQKGGRELWS